MATLIPAISACVSRMTSGERRVAERLEQKLDDDYLLWYDVPMGPRNTHPDFCVLHPRRGLLVLEVKDWKLSTIQQADKQTWEIIPDGIPKTVANPLEQARQYAHAVVNALQRDVCPSGTKFEGDNYVDGQWVRFQRGQVPHGAVQAGKHAGGEGGEERVIKRRRHAVEQGLPRKPVEELEAEQHGRERDVLVEGVLDEAREAVVGERAVD